MKKLIAIVGLFIYTASSAFAQAPEYNDLIILYADGNYAKLIREADKYTSKDASKNDALPYLWLSKGLFAISQVGDRDAMYKNAFKESIGALGKFRKKDKQGTIYAEHSEYIEEVKKSILEGVYNEVESKTYRKAIPLLMSYYKIMPDDLGGKYLEAACKFRENDKSGANYIWKDTDKKLLELTSLDGMSENDKKLLKRGVLETAACYKDSKQVDKANKILNKIAPFYEGDEEFKERSSEIMN
ncbi:MAG: hypothetical protein PHQ74_00395 [Crocinitomicaceae bacterium]|nr:hypothetical protein [Crocinitomicaceae bacterium]